MKTALKHASWRKHTVAQFSPTILINITAFRGSQGDSTPIGHERKLVPAKDLIEAGELAYEALPERGL